MLGECMHRDLWHGSFDLLEYSDLLRHQASKKQERNRQATLGQFLTPAPVARLLASMLDCRSSTIHILDPGAGVGSLFTACIAVLCAREVRPAHIHVTAYEIDETLFEYIHESLSLCQLACERAGISFGGEALHQDFLAAGAELLGTPRRPSLLARRTYTCVILNPPYRKIHTGSAERQLLKTMGMESSNLYTGFLATAMHLLDPQGELVAITPRSFCNGPYFQPFRKTFLEMMSLRHLHVFDSRNRAFRDDAVLQENIIVHAIKSPKKPTTVAVSSTHGPDDELALVHTVTYAHIVHPDDPHFFLHVVQDQASQLVAQTMARFQTPLAELGIEVSTGKVVDFRVPDLLRAEMETDTVPLLLPTHVLPGTITWPKHATKKPNALLDTARSHTLQVPSGYYVLVKRFSTKEEKKRLVAAVYDPTTMPGLRVSFENHLNYFHQEGSGLDPCLARGLAAYLNSTLVDAYFRQFNGHTQVNATDLRTLTYPTRAQLEALGRRISSPFPDQGALDSLLKEECFSGQRTEDPAEQAYDPIQARGHIEQALRVLKDLGFARQHQYERAALTLLALLHLTPGTPWSRAQRPLISIPHMLVFLREQYGKNYAPVPQASGRLQIVQQFLDSGLILAHPHTSVCPPTHVHTSYQIEQEALELFRMFETAQWAKNVSAYLAGRKAIQRRETERPRLEQS